MKVVFIHLDFCFFPKIIFVFWVESVGMNRFGSSVCLLCIKNAKKHLGYFDETGTGTKRVVRYFDFDFFCLCSFSEKKHRVLHGKPGRRIGSSVRLLYIEVWQNRHGVKKGGLLF